MSESQALPLTFDSNEARVLLRIRPTSSRRLSRRGHLHAVEWEGDWKYPSWQFAGRPRFAVLPGALTVVPAIPKDWSPMMINSFMSSHGAALSPVDWLIQEHDPHKISLLLENWRGSE